MNKYKAIKVNGEKIDEHRHIAQQRLGRKLSFNEVVHHIDEDKQNNSEDNLLVMSRADHCRIHYDKEKLKLPPELNKKLARQNRPIKKLKEEEAEAVRSLNKSGFDRKFLCRLYDINKSTLSRILNNKLWKK